MSSQVSDLGREKILDEGLMSAGKKNISNHVLETGPGISFEYFPAKSDEAIAKLIDVAHRLLSFRPAYQTVTFGAGGEGISPAQTTAKIINSLMPLGLETASHLAFSGQALADIHAFSALLVQNGCRHIIALRGDTAETEGTLPAYANVAAMVSDLKERHDFRIGVACYPEVHPKASSLEADLEALKAKEDAGADYAISQFFFHNDDFYKFIEAARRAGITIPIIPGIMPINSYAGIQRFAERCGASIPVHIHAAFENSHGEESFGIATQLLRNQIVDLVQNGVENIHIYTLNKYDLSAIACEAFYQSFGTAI